MTGSDPPASVLLVEADEQEREQIALWLEDAGFDVATCPGPTGPDYTCVGSRGGTCALANDASVVILDMSLESEAVLTGTPAEELLAMYLFAGHKIVALGSHPGGEVPGQLVRMHRHPERGALMGAVRGLLELGPGTGS
ncbi:MAG TPA: hypothetical protein VFK59_10070 [Actinomycetota bacterium]|jgi:hypothetical protein|nr:hypothetical protein [Actinomycetota bacterium]